jgi:hypothetical protein
VRQAFVERAGVEKDIDGRSDIWAMGMCLISLIHQNNRQSVEITPGFCHFNRKLKGCLMLAIGVCLFQLLTGTLPFLAPPGQPRRNIQGKSTSNSLLQLCVAYDLTGCVVGSGAVLWDTQKRAPNASETATTRYAFKSIVISTDSSQPASRENEEITPVLCSLKIAVQLKLV